MWKEIKKTISSNNSNRIFPTAITVDNEVITNPCDIVNAFNNYLLMHSINILFFFYYFPPLNIESLFVTPTNGTKVSNIICSLNQGKSHGPNSILIKLKTYKAVK